MAHDACDATLQLRQTLVSTTPLSLLQIRGTPDSISTAPVLHSPCEADFTFTFTFTFVFILIIIIIIIPVANAPFLPSCWSPSRLSVYQGGTRGT